MTARDALLILENLTARTGSGRLIFEALELVLHTGEVIGITGPSGSGKSTLLAFLAGLHNSTDISISGAMRDMQMTLQGEGRPFVSYVPQGPEHMFLRHFHTDATIRLLAEAGEFHDREKFGNRIDGLLKTLNLDRRLARRSTITSLSGGEAQRLALAVTLARDPQIWIADEPTASLDGDNKNRLEKHLGDIRQGKRTSMILASHDFKFLSKVCDRVFDLGEKGLTLRTASFAKSISQRPAGEKSDVAISVERVWHGYKGNQLNRKYVIRDFSLACEASKIHGIVGRSGIGKSTALRLLAGFERPQRGRIRRHDWLGRHQISAMLVPQDARQFFNPTQSIESFSRGLAKGQTSPPSEDHLIELLQNLKLNPALLREKPSVPSGGEIQRLALAVAVWLRPKLLCLDEIDSGLDGQNKLIVARKIEGYAKDHKSVVVLTTHDMDFANSLCHVIIDADINKSFGNY